jgi:hypothetical protein
MLIRLAFPSMMISETKLSNPKHFLPNPFNVKYAIRYPFVI